jgi:predicted HicB family RNase H-like nuclease
VAGVKGRHDGAEILHGEVINIRGDIDFQEKPLTKSNKRSANAQKNN